MDKFASFYIWGAQQALQDAGLTKEGAPLSVAHKLLGGGLLGAGTGAIAGGEDDRLLGALVGAGLGAAGAGGGHAAGKALGKRLGVSAGKQQAAGALKTDLGRLGEYSRAAQRELLGRSPGRKELMRLSQRSAPHRPGLPLSTPMENVRQATQLRMAEQPEVAKRMIADAVARLGGRGGNIGALFGLGGGLGVAGAGLSSED